MKKRLSLLLAILAVLVSTAMADNTISADPLTIAKSGTADLSINLTNTDAIAAVQFKVTLPDGISIVENEETISGSVKNEAYNIAKGVSASTTDRTNGWLLVGKKTTNNSYIFILISMAGETIAAGNGTIMKVSFQTTADAAIGENNVTISDIHFSVEGSSADQTMDDVTDIKVNISDILMGDVNGNGKVDIDDVTCTLREYVGKTNAVFIMNAGDINKNGRIDIDDVTSVLRIYVGKAYTRGITEENINLPDPD